MGKLKPPFYIPLYHWTPTRTQKWGYLGHLDIEMKEDLKSGCLSLSKRQLEVLWSPFQILAVWPGPHQKEVVYSLEVRKQGVSGPGVHRHSWKQGYSSINRDWGVQRLNKNVKGEYWMVKHPHPQSFRPHSDPQNSDGVTYKWQATRRSCKDLKVLSWEGPQLSPPELFNVSWVSPTCLELLFSSLVPCFTCKPTNEDWLPGIWGNV